MNLFKDSIKEKGLRVTAARVAVLKVLEDARKPLDIASIYTEVIKQHVDADQATIYRIIENFTQKDLINRLQFQEKKFYYEAKKYDHHHAICESCGAVDDVSNCAIDRVEREIEKVKGFQVRYHSLEFFGICKKCRVSTA